MAPPLGPYSGTSTSTLALVTRVSALSSGLIYGSIKLKALKARLKKPHKIAESEGHA